MLKILSTAHHPVREADRQARREQDDSRGSAANPKPAANEKPTMKAENVYAYLMANAFNPDQPREQDGKFAGLDSPLKASYRAEFGTKTQAQKAADTFGTKTEQQRMADDFGTKSEKERYADTFGTKTEQEKYAAYATPKSEDPDHVDVGEMMDYENGSMPNDKAVNMFQRLHNSGMAYQLQGHYGRTAQSLLKAGYIHDKVPELAAAVGVLGGAAALAGKLGKPKAE